MSAALAAALVMAVVTATAGWVANRELGRRHERDMAELRARQATLEAEDDARLKRLELREKQLAVLENVSQGARWSDEGRAEKAIKEMRRLIDSGDLDRYGHE